MPEEKINWDDWGYDYWWQQRLDDARYAQREEEGRCGNCGAFPGPDHVCPHILQLQSNANNPNK